MKDQKNLSKINKNSKNIYENIEDDKYRKRQSKKDFKRKKNSIEEEESWQDWDKYKENLIDE
jgi:hypothetical protein